MSKIESNLSSLLNGLLNKRYVLTFTALMLFMWSFDLCLAKTSSLHHNEDSNTVRHHHQHLSRQPRQQRDPNVGNEEKGYCAPYNGKICKNFISHQVWYSREDPTGGWKNEQITTALWEELIGDLTGLCRTAAEVSVIKCDTDYFGFAYLLYVFFVVSRNFFVLMLFHVV